MAKQKKSVKDTKQYIEADIAAVQEAHEMHTELSGPFTMPFKTKEGLVLLALAIILVAVNNTYTRYLGWACLLAAFFIPLIKEMFKRK